MKKLLIAAVRTVIKHVESYILLTTTPRCLPSALRLPHITFAALAFLASFSPFWRPVRVPLPASCSHHRGGLLRLDIDGSQDRFLVSVSAPTPRPTAPLVSKSSSSMTPRDGDATALNMKSTRSNCRVLSRNGPRLLMNPSVLKGKRILCKLQWLARHRSVLVAQCLKFNLYCSSGLKWIYDTGLGKLWIY